MKKVTILFIAVVTVAIAAMTIFYSCGKQDAGDPLKIGNQAISKQDVKINNLIKSFRSKMDYLRSNPEYKSGEVMEVDSAVWYLEATINYSHTFPNEYYGQMKIDTAYLTLTLNNDGMTDFEEVAQRYDEMKEEVRDFYYGSGFEEKGLVLVDLTLEPLKSDEVTLKMITVTGEKNNSTPPPGFGIDGPFVEGDDWWYGLDEGNCIGTIFISDAAQKVKSAMNDYIPDPNGSYFFINQFQIFRKGGNLDVRRSGDPEPLNNIYDYYLYSASEAVGIVDDDMLCLEYTEMNFYFCYLKYLLFTKLPDDLELPAGYCIESVIEMTGKYEFIEGMQSKHYYHEGTFQFGEKIFYDEGEEASEL